ncbi:helix-turn-helix domain-containing protein [Clostridium algidicarnis]|uniref:helix-turn-helix domain-containing protein n=1 Tax=Clostridium algidicarnis TaxID=37659 RepID=UPI003FD7E2C2
MDMNEKIKAKREELGLTLQEIGEYLGVSKATVQRYESGEIKNLKLGSIEKLAEILKISPSYLMGWEESKDFNEINGDVCTVEFYKILQSIMKERELTIPEISRMTGLPDSTIRSIISRKTKNISLEVASKLSRGLNISLEELNGETPNNKVNLGEEALLSNFNKLNTTGKDEAIKRVEELTEINKYTSKEDKDYLIPLAAHNKEGAEENIQHDIDLMKDDELWK